MAKQVGCRRVGLERCGIDVECNHCKDTESYFNSSVPKVIVPYVNLHPWVPIALEEQGPMDVLYCDTSASETAYWELLAARWALGETFICLEQDKIPTPGAIQELWNCKNLWCSYRVFIQQTSVSGNYPSLSCVKFDKNLMNEYPSLLEDVAKYDWGYGKKHWNRLDLGVYALLSEVCKVHWHAGELRVIHLHEGGTSA